MQFITERLLLRPWQAADLQAFAAMNADPEVMRYYPSTLSFAETEAFFKSIQTEFMKEGLGFWACTEKTTQQFMGYLSLCRPSFTTQFTPCVEIGWRLAKNFWNRGYATEGAKALLNYGFKVLALKEIVSFTSLSNFPSQRVMQKLGMHSDPKENFLNPRLTADHPLAWHCLYRLSANS